MIYITNIYTQARAGRSTKAFEFPPSSTVDELRAHPISPCNLQASLAQLAGAAVSSRVTLVTHRRRRLQRFLVAKCIFLVNVD